MDQTSDEGLTGRHEAAFSVFMGAIAFLWRGAGDFGNPALLGLFALLMAVNLAAGRALRRWPARRWLAAGIILANCAVVAGIVSLSGGGDSQFWVLYLLPVFSSCLLLGGRETLLVAAGAVAFNWAGAVPDSGVWGADDVFAAALKTAVLALAAAVTQRLAARERSSRAALGAERERVREKAALAEVGLLGAGVAHDLGNALGVILGYAEVALRAEGLPDDAAHDLAAIRRSALLAKRLAADLLGLSNRRRAKEDAELDALVAETLELSRHALLQAGVELRLLAGAGQARVHVDRAALQRLLLNLTANAARAMGRGGALTVTTSARGSQATVIVEDTGPGLPAAVLARLFQPFAQGGAADGHGLGLYLCAQAARDNDGALAAENPPSGGARFTMTLPVSGAAAVERQAAAAHAAAGL